MSIYKKISNPPETYVDGYGTTREMYEPGIIRLARKVYNSAGNFLNGKDNNLSDEEYIAKYGYAKPTASAGILDLLSPESAANLLKAEKAVAKAEQAATKAKRPRIKVKQAKEYEKVKSTDNAIVNSTKAATKIDEKPEPIIETYMNTLISAQNADAAGAPNLLEMFMQRANELRRQIPELNSPTYGLKRRR